MNNIIRNFLNHEGVAASVLPHLTLAAHLLLLALLCSAIGWACRRFLVPIVMKIVSKTMTVLDDYLINEPVLKGVCRIVPGMVFLLLLPYCFPGIEFESKPLVQTILEIGVKIYLTCASVLLVNAFLTNLCTFTTEQEKFKNHHLVSIVQFLKLISYCIGGIIVVAFLFNRSPINLIAGLGAAATVLMLVFRDSILGLVAGIQLSANKMLKPGDWITIKKLDIDGVVEELSLTTVKIRNFDNTISTVPPYTLVSDSFQNWTGMFESGARRFKRILLIDVNTIRACSEDELAAWRRKKLIDKADCEEESPVNLTLFRRYAERYLRQLSSVRGDQWLMARQLEQTPQGLPLELFFYFKETNFVKYEQLAAEVVEHFVATLPQFGLRLFQVPAGRDLEGFAKV